MVMVVREDPGAVSGAHPRRGSKALWPRRLLLLLPVRRRLGGAGRPTQTVARSDSSPYIRHRTGCECFHHRVRRGTAGSWLHVEAELSGAQQRHGTTGWGPDSLGVRLQGLGVSCKCDSTVGVGLTRAATTLTLLCKALSSATFPSVVHRSCSSGRRDKPKHRRVGLKPRTSRLPRQGADASLCHTRELPRARDTYGILDINASVFHRTTVSSDGLSSVYTCRLLVFSSATCWPGDISKRR